MIELVIGIALVVWAIWYWLHNRDKAHSHEVPRDSRPIDVDQGEHRILHRPDHGDIPAGDHRRDHTAAIGRIDASPRRWTDHISRGRDTHGGRARRRRLCRTDVGRRTIRRGVQLDIAPPANPADDDPHRGRLVRRRPPRYSTSSTFTPDAMRSCTAGGRFPRCISSATDPCCRRRRHRAGQSTREQLPFSQVLSLPIGLKFALSP